MKLLPVICKWGNRRSKFTQHMANPDHLTPYSVPGISLCLASFSACDTPTLILSQVGTTWQDSSWEGSKESICSQEAAPSSEFSNYLSPSLPPLPLSLTLTMIRKHRSSLKSIPLSYWHKLKLAVAHAVNSVGSQLIIFVNWKIDIFFISTICTFRICLLTLSLLGHVSHQK